MFLEPIKTEAHKLLQNLNQDGFWEQELHEFKNLLRIAGVTVYANYAEANAAPNGSVIPLYIVYRKDKAPKYPEQYLRPSILYITGKESDVITVLQALAVNRSLSQKQINEP
jgi:hypothetical protein